jgi:hypothetical protein
MIFTQKEDTMDLFDPALAFAADVLDDLERVRIANENRLRQLTRSVEDSDGELRGFGLDEDHPDVARLAAMVDTLLDLEKDATLNLQRHMRRHLLGSWVKTQKGIGDKQAARLLAAIGDPYIRPEVIREDGTVLPRGPRTVSALWAYCGLHVVPGQPCSEDQSMHAGERGDSGHDRHDTQCSHVGVAPRRRKGQVANWSGNAKMRVHLIAVSCMKVRDSPFRAVYDTRRKHTAVTHPDWSDGHSHNDALRVTSKEILKHLWRAARDLHLAP